MVFCRRDTSGTQGPLGADTVADGGSEGGMYKYDGYEVDEVVRLGGAVTPVSCVG